MVTAMIGNSEKGNVMVGHRTVCRDGFGDWHFKHLRPHNQVHIKQQTRSRIRKVHAVPRQQAAVK